MDRTDIIEKYQNLKTYYEEISKKIEFFLLEAFKEFEHIDKIASRAKSHNSFKDKINIKNENGSFKYPNPFIDVQDIIGARIVTYYKSDLNKVEERVKKILRFIEQKKIVPDDEKEFSYEGIHFICLIPPEIYDAYKELEDIPDFFELQIKTLYQHAWAQAEHGLGYKPGKSISSNERRKLAYLSALSWGADEILMELITSD